jgi:hypothetical protein
MEKDSLEKMINQVRIGPFNIGQSVLEGFDYLQELTDIYNGPNTRTDGWGPKEIPGNQP